VFLKTDGGYITTKEYGGVLDVRKAMSNAPTIPSNVGAILLSWEESLLLNESMQLNLERQFQGRNSRCRHLFQ
jgi:hypothetical protein